MLERRAETKKPRNLTCAGRSPLDALSTVPGPALRAWAMLAALAVILGVQLVMASLLPAEDRKTRLVTFLASGLKTAGTAQSSAFDVSAYAEGQIFVDVTAEAGTSTLDVTVQSSPDNVTWYTHTIVGQITATGQTVAELANFGKWMRISYTVGGTSMTFSVVGMFKN